jgi:hypothetical protein
MTRFFLVFAMTLTCLLASCSEKAQQNAQFSWFSFVADHSAAEAEAWVQKQPEWASVSSKDHDEISATLASKFYDEGQYAGAVKWFCESGYSGTQDGQLYGAYLAVLADIEPPKKFRTSENKTAQSLLDAMEAWRRKDYASAASLADAARAGTDDKVLLLWCSFVQANVEYKRGDFDKAWAVLMDINPRTPSTLLWEYVLASFSLEVAEARGSVQDASPIREVVVNHLKDSGYSSKVRLKRIQEKIKGGPSSAPAETAATALTQPTTKP